MRATGLRRVTGLVGSAALVAGCLLTTPFGARSAHADEGALKAAFDDYAAGKYEDALKKLQEYVQSNPGDEEVYNVLRNVDERVKLRALVAGGDHERLMRYLLDKAKPTVEAKKRDPDAIKKLVDEALSGELDTRRRAGLELGTRSGDYAVPYLLPHLADADAEKVVNAIFAFHSIGGEAVLPLSQAMATSDARLRGYIAVVLGDIGDPRALPVLRRAAEKDADESVKAKANAAIAKIGGAGGNHVRRGLLRPAWATATTRTTRRSSPRSTRSTTSGSGRATPSCATRSPRPSSARSWPRCRRGTRSRSTRTTWARARCSSARSSRRRSTANAWATRLPRRSRAPGTSRRARASTRPPPRCAARSTPATGTSPSRPAASAPRPTASSRSRGTPSATRSPPPRSGSSTPRPSRRCA